jgi:phospholipid/cholesterol/gamma-HCH transport system substrate-binding protein
MNVETKVGIFTLSGLVILAVGILILGDIQVKQQWQINIMFDNAEGLPDKGPVKVAGVEVGKVHKITLAGERARVTVRLNKEVEVHRDAHAAIASTGLIGTKYVDLDLGTPAAPLLKEKDTIEGESGYTFDDVMKELRTFFKDDGKTGSLADNFKVTVANLRHVSEALDKALGQQDQKLSEIVANVRDLSAHAKHISMNLDEITTDHKMDMGVALEKIRSITERMDELLAKVQRGEGTVGKLISDEQMGNDLKSAFTEVKKAATDASRVLGRIAMIDVYWDYRQRYDFEDDKWRADLGLRIVPRPGKFYFIEGNNLGKREDRTVAGNDLEKKDTVTAVMGRDFGPLTLYGGVIRSAGGAGVNFRPLFALPKWNRRFELEGEAYDFPRDEVIQGVRYNSPVYNAGARVNVADPWLWVGGQVEDIAERKNFNANVNVTFKDEDISYLLGLVGLARP